MLNLLLEPISLGDLAIELKLLILYKLFDDFLVMKGQLIESLLEPSGVIVLLVLELIESLLISIHFVSIIGLS